MGIDFIQEFADDIMAVLFFFEFLAEHFKPQRTVFQKPAINISLPARSDMLDILTSSQKGMSASPRLRPCQYARTRTRSGANFRGREKGAVDVFMTYPTVA